MNVLARRAFGALRTSALPRATVQARSLHFTAPVLKKKKVADIDSLFDDFEIVDESLPPSPSQTSSTSATAAASGETSTSGRLKQSNKLSPEQRKQNFNDVLADLKPRIGRKPILKGMAARDSAWLQLMQFASTEAELREMVDLMPEWSAGGRTFTPTISEKFARRCEELDCPHLALEVYGNFAKYQLKLSLPAGRQLLHSLHNGPIENVVAAAALYEVHGLPSVSQDYISCALTVDACLRANTVDSRIVAKPMHANLQNLKAAAQLDVNDTSNRANVWVQKAMESIGRKEHILNNIPRTPEETTFKMAKKDSYIAARRAAWEKQVDPPTWSTFDFKLT